MTKNPVTRDDLTADIEHDITTAREAQRTATAAGDHFTAQQCATEIDSYLDERQHYSY
jgi:hypothetical protein